jgi:4-hydroxybenzoate polyprenyltransferase
VSDWIFAFVHLFLLLAVVVYAGVSLVQGNTLRFAVIGLLLAGYYILVLHKAVKKEISRRQSQRKNR